MKKRIRASLATLAKALVLSCFLVARRAHGFSVSPKTVSNGHRRSSSRREAAAQSATRLDARTDHGEPSNVETASRWTWERRTDAVGHSARRRAGGLWPTASHAWTIRTSPSFCLASVEDATAEPDNRTATAPDSQNDEAEPGVADDTITVGAIDEEVEEVEEIEEEEEEDYDDDDFEELPEEIDEQTRGAFLDRPMQVLNIEKILAETDYIDHSDVPEGYRTGYVSIVGSPNVGKSTLMNNMIGDRLSIVTPKAGTTRHRITGVMTGDDFQMIYQDTPGVLTPAYMLHEGMMNFVQEAMGDADAILFVTDLFETDFASTQIFERMLSTGKPIVVAINKVDLLPTDGTEGHGKERPGVLAPATLKEVGSLEDVMRRWQDRLPGATVLPISALESINTEELAEELKQHMPEGPPLFHDDVMSDKPQRFFASEIIREQIFGSFSQEIPYSCEVRLESFKERKSETVIDATIIVSQESQKGMVIGKGGAKIKEVGIKARVALEMYLATRVNLRLSVKVDKNWRRKKSSLKQYGYMT